MPQRVRLLITHASMHFGGVETQLIALLGGLDPAVYEAHLALCHLAGERLADVPGSVTVHDLGCPARSDLQPRLALRVARLVARLAPDLCLSFHPYTNLGTQVGVWLVGQRNGLAGPLPVVASLAGHVTRGRLDFLRAPILRRMSSVCCVAEGVAASAVRCYGPLPRVCVIHNCVDVVAVERLAREPVDHPWLTANSCPVVVTASRLARSKGVDFLLRAFASLLSLRPARLLVIGDGPERARLQNLAELLGVAGQVDFLGYQRNPYKFVSRCAAFIFAPAYGEGLPTVLLEAMACRTPVVTAGYAGVEDTVQDGVTGVVVPARDARRMAAAIGGILEPGAQRARLSEAAYARVVCEFSRERYVERYEQLFHSLLHHSA